MHPKRRRTHTSADPSLVAGDEATRVRAVVEAFARQATRERLLLFDLDGTLCELRRDPASVQLPAHRRELLEALAASPDVYVGVISGRRLAEVRRIVNLKGPAVYGGLHGLEIESPDRVFTHPALSEQAPVMAQLHRGLVDELSGMNDVFIELKEASVAVHWRGGGRTAERTALDAVAAVSREGIREQRGRSVIELVPDVEWNKGFAIDWIREARGSASGRNPWTLYAGDDDTDERGFEHLGPDDLSVVVGARPSRATHRLRNPTSLTRCLRGFIEAAVSPPGRQKRQRRRDKVELG